jgi:hypothetical protein
MDRGLGLWLGACRSLNEDAAISLEVYRDKAFLIALGISLHPYAYVRPNQAGTGLFDSCVDFVLREHTYIPYYPTALPPDHTQTRMQSTIMGGRKLIATHSHLQAALPGTQALPGMQLDAKLNHTIRVSIAPVTDSASSDLSHKYRRTDRRVAGHPHLLPCPYAPGSLQWSVTV